MRARTFLLLLIVLVLIGAILFYVLDPLGVRRAASVTPLPESTGEIEQPVETTAETPNITAPPTPTVNFVDVVVANTYIPLGTRLTSELLTVVRRPDSNTAIVANVTFSDISQVEGQIAKTDIARGQEVLIPMIALNVTDLASIGSDLALFVEDGRVAVAFPIDRFNGVAYSMRPGDFIDVMMSLSLVQIDPEFRTALPNLTQRVDQQALLDGQSFLFPPTAQGRLELVPVINLVAEITPGNGQAGLQLPRQVTQLTLQQAEVLWVGTWRDTRAEEIAALEAKVAQAGQDVDPEAVSPPQPTPVGERPETNPDVVILSMPVQDALALKWAQETGIEIDLALRAQGDNSISLTTSIHLLQLIDQGGLTIPDTDTLEYDLDPRYDEVPVPFLPAIPPSN